MNIEEIYNKFNIHTNLRQHMLRVASLAKKIIDNWSGDKINETAILQACLFHDAAKIIKFKYFDGNDADYWKNIQQEMIDKYGNNEHEATLKICREAGVSEEAIKLLEEKNIRPYIERVRKIADSKDYGLKIVQYCDARTAPDGLVSLNERYAELMKRDSTKKMDDEAVESMDLLFEIENQIQENTTIDLRSISREEIEKHIIVLRQLKI